MIRLINYPYKKWNIGDIIDLGKAKNESMISMGRAVAVAKPQKKVIKKTRKVKKSKK